MLVLHDEATCLHRTVELLGSKFAKALECPERIEAILDALRQDSSHHIRTLDIRKEDAEGVEAAGDLSVLSKLLNESHDPGYLTHLRTTHADWVENGLVDQDDSVFPECFQPPGMSRPIKDRGPPKDRFARPGYYAFDMSTGIAKDTWTAARASANLAAVAARLAVVPENAKVPAHRDVLALCRPPGHHCTTKLAGGYCYINNAVVAVHSLRHYAQLASDGTSSSSQDYSLNVAILDLDFHHGNGTQAYFYADPSVLYVSIHGEDEYPYYSGFEDETGEASGDGYNLNLPLASNSSVEQYLAKLDTAVKRIQEFRPAHVIISLGYDTYRLDPIGKFDLDTDDYEVIARRVRGAEGLRDAPATILLEGGYVLEKLGENMLSFLRGWEATRA